MDKETEEYYDRQFSLFTHSGWKDLMDQVKEMVDAYNSIQGVDTIEKLYFKKGQLDMLTWLAKWETTVQETWDNIQNAPQTV